MHLTPFFLASLSFGLVSPTQLPWPEDDVPTTLLRLHKPVILDRNPPIVLSKRAGQAEHEQHLPQPTDPELTKLKPDPTMRTSSPHTRSPSRRKPFKNKSELSTSDPSTSDPSTSEPSTSQPSTSKSTVPQIEWSNDYGTNLVRKNPVLFLPPGSKDKDWDTHVCETLRRDGYTSCNAEIKLGPRVRGRPGHPYTVVSNLKPEWRNKITGLKTLHQKMGPLIMNFDKKPLVGGFSDVRYISRDGRVLPARPEAPQNRLSDVCYATSTFLVGPCLMCVGWYLGSLCVDEVRRYGQWL